MTMMTPLGEKQLKESMPLSQHTLYGYYIYLLELHASINSNISAIPCCMPSYIISVWFCTVICYQYGSA